MPVVLALVVMALLVTACQKVEVATYDATHKPDLALRYLTRDGTDRYVLTAKPGQLRIDAPTSNVGSSGGSNTRAVIWPPSTKSVSEAMVCATWTDAEGQWVQQGFALRVRTDGNRFRAVVVTKNVLYGAEWQFNVQTWDSTRSKRLQVHGAAILRTPFAKDEVPRPLPWKVCARTEGNIIRVKGWRAAESEPSWHDKSHTGAVTLPDGWTFAGKTGWYGGHIPPGGTIGTTDLRTSTWELRADS